MENIDNKYEIHRIKTDPGQSMIRIDKFIFDRIENASRTKIQEACKEGYVTVNGTEVKSNYKVKPGDEIIIYSEYEPKNVDVIAEDIPINVVFEDDYFLIVNKEPEMVVHPSYGHYTGTLVNAIMHHLKDLPLFNTGEARPGLVHRIDKNTSGLLVIAKTEEALANISKQFFDRTTDRRYTALVWGTPAEAEGTIDAYVGRSPKNRKVMHVFPDGEHGKHAITHYKIIENLGYVTLIECKLETGRTHQIRVHMKYIGHPLFNDNEYGGDQILKGTRFTKYKQFVQNCFNIIPRQALHARTLAFDHPKTGERMSFTSELPDDFKKVIEKWRNYINTREIE
jgi:23S rRNA pseudouridine1911/1915/1917 synthase